MIASLDAKDDFKKKIVAESCLELLSTMKYSR